MSDSAKPGGVRVACGFSSTRGAGSSGPSARVGGSGLSRSRGGSLRAAGAFRRSARRARFLRDRGGGSLSLAPHALTRGRRPHRRSGLGAGLPFRPRQGHPQSVDRSGRRDRARGGGAGAPDRALRLTPDQRGGQAATWVSESGMNMKSVMRSPFFFPRRSRVRAPAGDAASGAPQLSRAETQGSVGDTEELAPVEELIHLCS